MLRVEESARDGEESSLAGSILESANESDSKAASHAVAVKERERGGRGERFSSERHRRDGAHGSQHHPASLLAAASITRG